MVHTAHNLTIDLHLHTTASDGMLSPNELVEQAVVKKKAAIAITDHDTIAGISSAINAAQDFDIEIVPGVEFSVCFTPTMHILGFYLDITHPCLIAELMRLEKIRYHLIAKAFSRMRQFSICVSPQKLKQDVGTITISKLKEYLIANELSSIGDPVDQSLQYLLNDWKSALLSPEACISLIHQCRGIAVLAHPVLLGYSFEELDLIIGNLKRMGLDGLEIDHPLHSVDERRKLDDIRCRYALIKSGGSDFHRTNYLFSDIEDISYKTLENIKYLWRKKFGA